jgi:hypothetical protein
VSSRKSGSAVRSARNRMDRKKVILLDKEHGPVLKPARAFI